MKNRNKVFAMACAAGLTITGCASSFETVDVSTAAAATITTTVAASSAKVTAAETTSQEVVITTLETENQITLASTEEQSSSVETSYEEIPSSEEISSSEVISSEKHIICIDPGHGGMEYGAMFNGLLEKDLSLKVGLYLEEYLMSNYSDVQVVMTRTEDIKFGTELKEDLQKRCDIAHECGAEYMISLHFNADGAQHESRGSMILASTRPGLKEQGDALGNLVIQQLSALGIGTMGVFFRESDTYFYPDGTPMDYYAVVRHCAEYGIPGIIIEHLFVDNPEDAKFADTEEEVKNLALADGKAIAQYFNLTPKN